MMKGAFKQWILSGLVAAGICQNTPVVSAEPLAGKETQPQRQTMAVVLNQERPVKSDLLLLRNGEKLKGALLNGSFTLRTAYAQLKLERRVLAGIDLADGTGGIGTVFTVNKNQLTGFLENASFIIQPEAGDRMEVRREKVLQVIFGVREEELKGIAQGKWIRLQNGDRLSGELLADSLKLVTTNGEVVLTPMECMALRCSAGSTAQTTVSLRNGKVLQGTLANEDLLIRLDVGPDVSFYCNWITSIGDPESSTEVAAAAPESPVGELPKHGSPASGSTNLEGLVWIAAGEFVMGSSTEEIGRDLDEGPQTKVVVPQGFWMGKCEVTQAEYQRVMGLNPSNNTGDTTRPIEKVSWYEAVEYCTKLTQRDEQSGRLPKGYVYRLPTEAEWEYACRAGTTTRFSYGEDKGDAELKDYAWFTRNSESMTHSVATRRANPWGLFDMHGNVWEWCLDRWEGALPGGSVTNRPTSAEGTLRVARGGSWLYEPRACRSANRDDYSASNRCADLGFRIVLAPVQP